MVEVDAGDDGEGGVGGRGGAEDAGVGADVGADPVSREVEGVGEDGELPRLEGNVGLPEPGVGEGEARVDGDRVGQVVALVGGVDLGPDAGDEEEQEEEVGRRHGKGQERDGKSKSHM